MMASCDQCGALFNDRRERYELRSVRGFRLYAVTCSESCAYKYANQNNIQNYSLKEVRND